MAKKRPSNRKNGDPKSPDRDLSRKAALARPNSPASFLTVRAHTISGNRAVQGLCVGYEQSKWRMEALVDHIVEWLPEFALTPSEWLTIDHSNSVPMLRHAARTVYKSEKFRKRGEFGELFLHAAIRQTHDSLPAISKIFYKKSANDTVKGFDAVHVVGPPDAMELWLGEAKFYKSISRAIKAVINELETHLGTDYLRDEFLLLAGKIDDAWPHAAVLRKLLSPNTSLDQVFTSACIPVLLTYDSSCIASYDQCSEAYVKAFEAEIGAHFATFLKSLAGKSLPVEVRIHLFLLPLAEKQALAKALHEKLKAWQNI